MDGFSYSFTAFKNILPILGVMKVFIQFTFPCGKYKLFGNFPSSVNLYIFPGCNLKILQYLAGDHQV
jgi:hypothetical protein